MSLSKWVLLAAVALPGCDDDKVANGNPGPGKDAGLLEDSGKPVDSGNPSDSGNPDTGNSDSGLKPCLEQPGDLPRPPSGGLPCDLLPPNSGQ
jgi:hypothetical protein